jgi:hypothetical protein
MTSDLSDADGVGAVQQFEPDWKAP